MFFLQNVLPPGNMDCCLPCDRSAAHRSRWQDLELIFLRLLQHGNRRARGESVVFASLRPAETFMRAYTRPTEAVCCRNQRFLRYAYAARFRVIQTRKTLRALHVYTQTVIGVFFVDGNGNMHACLTRWCNLFYSTSMDAIFTPSQQIKGRV